MEKLGKFFYEKREYFIMGMLLAFVLFAVPVMLCHHGNVTLHRWMGLSYALLGMAVILFSLGGYFFRSNKKYFAFLSTFAAFLAMPIWAAVISGIEVTWLDKPELLCWSLIFAFVMSAEIFLVSNIFRRTWLKIICFLLISFPSVMFAATFVGYIFSSHAWPNTEAFMMILQTNPSEALEYCQNFLSFWNVLALAAFFAIWFGFAGWSGKTERIILDRTNVFLYGTLVIMVAYLGYRVMEQPALPYVTLVQETRKGYALYEEFEKNREARMAHVNNLVPSREANKGVYILVIGESQNKQHMSAYGYDRKTTPWLDSMINKPGTVLLKNARSCHIGTMRSLSYALTAKNQYNDINLEDAVTLAEAAKSAGFYTVWMSNQIKYSVHDTPTTVIASETDRQIWMNHHLGETTKIDVFDGALVNELSKIERSDRMLIIVHLMGNHIRYSDRYPLEFAKFSGRGGEIDTYDNSMLYNDYVMQRMYETVKEWPDFAGLFYTSDHGEDPDTGLSHNLSHFTWPMTQIPIYMIFSESYQREHSEQYGALKNAQSKPFTNDLMFNVVLSSMGVDYPELYEAVNDIASEQYDDNPNRFKTLLGEKKIEW